MQQGVFGHKKNRRFQFRLEARNWLGQMCDDIWQTLMLVFALAYATLYS